MIDKVLLVDDDDITLLICEVVLKRNNFTAEVIKVHDGQEAIEFYAQYANKLLPGKPPLFIFLDLNMPIMNGWDFLEDFAERFQLLFPATRVIVLSSSIDPEDLARSHKNNNIITFISKPITDSSVDYLKTLEQVKPYFN